MNTREDGEMVDSEVEDLVFTVWCYFKRTVQVLIVIPAALALGSYALVNGFSIDAMTRMTLEGIAHYGAGDDKNLQYRECVAYEEEKVRDEMRLSLPPGCVQWEPRKVSLDDATADFGAQLKALYTWLCLVTFAWGLVYWPSSPSGLRVRMFSHARDAVEMLLKRK